MGCQKKAYHILKYPQWSGNISAMEWKTPAVDGNWHAYKYSYDNLSRLTSGNYSSSSTAGSGYGTKSGHFDETYTYDVLGNMLTLLRKHNNTNLDQLTFNYTNTGNRLKQLTNAVGNTTTTYVYSNAGRMISDSQKGTVTYNHLGLVKDVTKSSQKLEYTYDATGKRLKKKFGGAERHYMDGVEYKGAAIDFVSTSYGRIRKSGSDWIYDVFLKDHLGNVRAVLEAGSASSSSSKSNTVTYLATMEENRAAEEEQYFANVAETRADMPFNYPHKSPTNTKLSKVPGKSEGLKIMIKVMAGDTLEISAKAFYNMDNSFPGASVNVVPIVGAVLAGMYNPLSTVGEYSQLANNLGTTASNSTILSNLPGNDDNQNKTVQPQSGINFVLYNGNFDVIEENTGYLPVDDKINAIQVLATDRMIMTEAGFFEVFINNQAQTPVYYDNMMITMSSGSVMEVNAYYSFGKRIPLLSSPANLVNLSNKYLYNEKEIQTELDLNWHDYGERMLNGERWFVPDPLAEKYYHISPYAYCLNNPIFYVDPDGREVSIKHLSATHQKSLQTFMSSPTGMAFVGRYMSAGQTLTVNGQNYYFDKTGDRAKDLLSLQSRAMSALGENQTLIKGTKGKTLNELSTSDVNKIIQEGVQQTIMLNENLDEKNAVVNLGHEAFVHADKAADALSALEKNSSSMTQSAKIDALMSIPTSADKQHKELGSDMNTKSKQLMNELTNKTGDKFYNQEYEKQVQKFK